MRYTRLGIVMGMVWVAMVTVRAHETTFMGMVELTEKTRVQVRVVDPEGKRPDTHMWFTVADSTKVTRGDKAVAWAEAALSRGERIVVVVAHGDEAAKEWTCPMHPEVALEKAGQCPKCQMTLRERERPAKASQIKLAAS